MSNDNIFRSTPEEETAGFNAAVTVVRHMDDVRADADRVTVSAKSHLKCD